jgi:hypothetical protein
LRLAWCSEFWSLHLSSFFYMQVSRIQRVTGKVDSLKSAGQGTIIADRTRPGRPNGLEMSRPAAQAPLVSLYGNLAGITCADFAHASRVSCSQSFGGRRA